jgi:hypothetical protein
LSFTNKRLFKNKKRTIRKNRLFSKCLKCVVLSDNQNDHLNSTEILRLLIPILKLFSFLKNGDFKVQNNMKTVL